VSPAANRLNDGETRMFDAVDEILFSYKEEMINSLRDLLRIRSVAEETGDPEMPFGEGVESALTFILELGRQKGFDCDCVGHYACALSFGGGKDSVGAVSHLDVVPAGQGWNCDPFGGELAGDRIYGRGAVDDKGPLMAVFYAMLAIKESGIPLGRKLSHIIATNEESGVFPGLKYYMAHREMPAAGFVPDAWFPAVFAEKGFWNYIFSKHTALCGGGSLVLKNIEGGEAFNIAAPSASAVFEADGKGMADILRAQSGFGETGGKLSVSAQGRTVTVSVLGKAAHASTPEEGINAISVLLRYLDRLDFAPTELCGTLRALSGLVARDTNGKGLGADCRDETGSLTNNVGMISLRDGVLEVGMNLRSPVGTDPEELEKKLGGAAEKPEWRTGASPATPRIIQTPRARLLPCCRRFTAG